MFFTTGKPSMLCFKSFNFLPSTPHLVRRDAMQRIQGRTNRVAVKLTPSITPQSEEISGRFSHPMTDDQTNVVGILGGYSCLSFAKKLAQQKTELPFILCTDPSLSNGLLSVDRSSSPLISCKPAVEALSTKDFEGAQNLVRIALQVLLIKSVNRIVLACDELRRLLPPNDPLWRKCIDPTDALARSAIEYAQSANKES